MVITDGVPRFDLERAHIFPEQRGGPREDWVYPMDKHEHFENLILLCKPHHVRVDKKELGKHPAEVARLEACSGSVRNDDTSESWKPD